MHGDGVRDPRDRDAVGYVAWSSDSSGTFSDYAIIPPLPPTCTLNGTGSSASCSIRYTPTAVGTGTHTIIAKFDSIPDNNDIEVGG